MSFFRFFLQLHVKDKDGKVLVPKKNTLAVYKSGIQMEVEERYKVQQLALSGASETVEQPGEDVG